MQERAVVIQALVVLLALGAPPRMPAPWERVRANRILRRTAKEDSSQTMMGCSFALHFTRRAATRRRARVGGHISANFALASTKTASAHRQRGMERAPGNHEDGRASQPRASPCRMVSRT